MTRAALLALTVALACASSAQAQGRREHHAPLTLATGAKATHALVLPMAELLDDTIRRIRCRHDGPRLVRCRLVLTGRQPMTLRTKAWNVHGLLYVSALLPGTDANATWHTA